MRVGRINDRALRDAARADAVRQQTKAGAERVAAEARRLAPVLTGTLRRSITVQEVPDAAGLVEFRVGWDRDIADYGWIVEAGSEDTPAQPHLRPAANKFKR